MYIPLYILAYEYGRDDLRLSAGKESAPRSAKSRTWAECRALVVSPSGENG